jgi:thioredoxin-dependent peroxiredoxin
MTIVPGVVLKALAALLLAAPPKVGDVAPDFTVADTDGKQHRLSKMVKDGPVILAFFPKAFTGGWTQELSAYRDRYGELTKQGGQVLAISGDSAETQAEFKAELKAPFPFIADPDAKLIGLYDVKTPLLDYAKRVTFVIGPDRRIVRVDEGGDAIDPAKSLEAVTSCSVPP